VTVVLTQGITSQTLMRTRGSVLAWLDASGSAAGDIVDVAVALFVQPAGSGAVSTPITDIDASYFWFTRFHLATEIAFPTGGDGQPGILWNRIDVDSKAMRVIRPDMETVMIVETADVVGAPVVNVVGSFRFLISS